MELQDLIKKISDESNVVFGPASPEDLDALSRLKIPAKVIDFYKKFEPKDCVEIDGVRLWPIAEVLRENADYVPGSDLQKYGYIVFATTFYGDAYCFDTTELNEAGDVSVVLMAHEIYFPELSVDEIKLVRTKVAENLEDFLQKFLTDQLKQEPLYGPG